MKFDIYRNKTVLVTGHTGFKGSWLTLWLKHLNARVVGLSLDVPTNPSHYNSSMIYTGIDDHRADIKKLEEIKSVVLDVEPDFIFHLAAQPLVRLSYDQPLNTIFTNAIGSVNILDALREVKRSTTVVMITSDKAYDNLEWSWGYRETDRLGGDDPYSASKGMAEIAIKSYHKSFYNSSNSQIRIGVGRAGNVIGGGDWALDRIVPDCMKSWSKNDIVNIRNPNSTRPWQHVLEPLSGYLLLGEKLKRSNELNGEAYNFGPASNQNFSVKDLINEMGKHWEKVKWNISTGDNPSSNEAGLLKLNCDKALFDLSWVPTLEFEETVEMTVHWYKEYYNNSPMDEYSLNQIIQYMQLAKQRRNSWAID